MQEGAIPETGYKKMREQGRETTFEDRRNSGCKEHMKNMSTETEKEV